MDRSFGDRIAWRQGLWWLGGGLALGAILLSLPLGDGNVPLIAGLAAGCLCAAWFLRARRKRSVQAAGALDGSGAALLLPPRARDVLERLPDPLMLLDEGGRVVLANKAMVEVVGTDTQKKHVSAVLRTPAVLKAIERTAESGEPTSVEYSVHVPVEQSYQAYVTRTDHTPRLTALLLHNVTAARRAEVARADFVANASHELRTPLAALSGFIDTLKGHARDDAAAREQFLDIMGVEAGRMSRLIDDLLSLTRIEQNEHVPPQGEVDLLEVVKDATAAMQGLARVEEVTLSVEEQGNLPPITGERDELIQLFQNLIHNAIKYGRQGGHVWISLSVAPSSSILPGRHGAGSLVAVAVKDDGEGIPREVIPRLTERFYRVDVRRSRERGGTGLGLAIVKHIVNRHHGKLLIDSKLGEGSTFTVLLPAAAPAPRPSAAAEPVTEMI